MSLVSTDQLNILTVDTLSGDTSNVIDSITATTASIATSALFGGLSLGVPLVLTSTPTVIPANVSFIINAYTGAGNTTITLPTSSVPVGHIVIVKNAVDGKSVFTSPFQILPVGGGLTSNLVLNPGIGKYAILIKYQASRYFRVFGN